MTTPLLDPNGKLNGESVRYVAIGDSFTEGVGDVDRRRPNSLRGWAAVSYTHLTLPTKA